MKILFLELARLELDQAVDFYSHERPDVALRFRNEVVRSLDRVAEYPNAFPLISKRARRCLVAGFPYGIIYQYKPDESCILVVAVAHLHRKPKYWLTRKPAT